MGHVRVITDSACDLPKSWLEELDIEVVPLSIRFGDEEFTDGVDLSADDFWKRCRESDKLPETAAPSPGAFQAAYERAAADGCAGVVAVTLSKDLSGTFQAATVGAEATSAVPVKVVDSRTVTAAQGMLVLDAAEFARTGAGIEDVASRVESRIADSDVAGTLNTLDHLIKGGRLSGAKALFGSLLSVKPLLTVRDGKVVEDGRQRTRARAIEHICARAESAGPVDWLACAGGDADDLGTVAERLAKVHSDHPLIVTEIGPVVGTHGGPGIIGVCWLKRR